MIAVEACKAAFVTVPNSAVICRAQGDANAVVSVAWTPDAAALIRS
jgi:hypothetical protein